MKQFYSTHYPSPLLVEVMQREVLRNPRKFFKLFRERCEKKGPFVLQHPRFFNVNHFYQQHEVNQ